MPLFTFGQFELDSGARRLTRDGERLAIPDRHLSVLLHLVANAGRSRVERRAGCGGVGRCRRDRQQPGAGDLRAAAAAR